MSKPARKRKDDPGLLDGPIEVAAEETEGADVDDLAYLGREFLTWLLWRVDTGAATFGEDDDAVDFVFGGKVRIGGLIGEATDLVIKGAAPAHSIEARAAIGAGRTLREAEMRVTRGEREWPLSPSSPTRSTCAPPSSPSSSPRRTTIASSSASRSSRSSTRS